MGTEQIKLTIIRGQNNLYNRALKLLGIIVLCSFILLIITFLFDVQLEQLDWIARWSFAFGILILLIAIRIKPPLDFSTELLIDKTGIIYASEGLQLSVDDIVFAKVLYKSYRGEIKRTLTDRYSQPGWNNSLQIKTKQGIFYNYQFYVKSPQQANEIFNFCEESDFLQLYK